MGKSRWVLEFHLHVARAVTVVCCLALVISCVSIENSEDEQEVKTESEIIKTVSVNDVDVADNSTVIANSTQLVEQQDSIDLLLTDTVNLPYLSRALAGEFSGKRVTVAGGWSYNGANDLNNLFDAFEKQTGLIAEYQSISAFETRIHDMISLEDIPEVLHFFQPGLLKNLANSGLLKPLSEWLDKKSLNEDYPFSLLETYSVNDEVYGLPFNLDIKSQVYYRPNQFRIAGFRVPTTMAELKQLSSTIVERGLGNPWCVGTLSGKSTGYVTTDWLEDLVLRFGSDDIYDQWVNHEIPFDHSAILRAADELGSMWFSDHHVYGGIEGILNIEVGAAMKPFFSDRFPRCWMHKQAFWIMDTWETEDGTVPKLGEEVDYFLLPPIVAGNPPPLLAYSAAVAITTEAAEARAVVELMRTAEAYRAMIQRGGIISPNKMVPVDWYPKEYRKLVRTIIESSDTLRYDASDLMPPEIGSDVFWRKMTDWVRGGGENTKAIFAEIESAWQSD